MLTAGLSAARAPLLRRPSPLHRSPRSLPLLRIACLALGAAACGVAWLLAPDAAQGAAGQAWPPFVLCAGLLVIGAVAQAGGLFESTGGRLGRLGGSPSVLLLAMLGLVAAVTVVLNLDTAAAFLTPVVIVVARRRGLPDDAFLYGTLFMTNSASLLLPGSNLTNLLVFGDEPLGGAAFAARMGPAWLAAVFVTGVFVVIAFRRDLGAPRLAADAAPPGPMPEAMAGAEAPRTPRLAWLVVAVAAVLVVAMPEPALPVLALGVLAALGASARANRVWRQALWAADPLVLTGLFGIAVALGALARAWSAPSDLIASSSAATVVAVAAASSVTLNNLPAALLLAAPPVAQPEALLLGLNLGPNLAVTGSLAAFVWMKAARASGAAPDWRRVSVLGAVLAPLSLAAATAALLLWP